MAYHEWLDGWSPSPIPVDEIDETGDAVTCTKCGERIEEDAYYYDEGCWCEACIELIVDEFADEAEAFAKEHCKITSAVEVYDDENRYAPTPEGYALGDKEAYTENSVGAHNRHSCTNYEDLVKGLDRDSLGGQLYDLAIRHQIEELLDEAAELRREAEIDGLFDEEEFEDE